LDIAFDSCENKHLNYQKFLGGRNAISLEDPFATDDWRTWTEFTKSWGAQILIVADDLVATNPVRLKKAIELAAANAVIIKPNQIGTLTETLEVVKMARESGWKTIVSHRADETSDDFIADLAVGVGADYVKFGGFSRGERLAKYNRLLGIQKEL
jgi:enolase